MRQEDSKRKKVSNDDQSGIGKNGQIICPVWLRFVPTEAFSDCT